MRSIFQSDSWADLNGDISRAWRGAEKRESSPDGQSARGLWQLRRDKWFSVGWIDPWSSEVQLKTYTIHIIRQAWRIFSFGGSSGEGGFGEQPLLCSPQRHFKSLLCSPQRHLKPLSTKKSFSNHCYAAHRHLRCIFTTRHSLMRQCHYSLIIIRLCWCVIKSKCSKTEIQTSWSEKLCFVFGSVGQSVMMTNDTQHNGNYWWPFDLPTVDWLTVFQWCHPLPTVYHWMFGLLGLGCFFQFKWYFVLNTSSFTRLYSTTTAGWWCLWK